MAASPLVLGQVPANAITSKMVNFHNDRENDDEDKMVLMIRIMMIVGWKL